jgi:predicted nucleic acid-binding protein
VSGDGGAVPAPLILDVSVLIAVARGDARVMDLIQGYDADGQPLVIPALAITGALHDISGRDAEAMLRGLEMLDNTMTAALRDAEQAAHLAAVISRTGLSPWDAHVAAVADASVCAILTLDARKWREHSGDLDERLYFIEISDPEED